MMLCELVAFAIVVIDDWVGFSDFLGKELRGVQAEYELYLKEVMA